MVQWVRQSVSQWVRESANQWVSQSVSQWVSQSVSQRVCQYQEPHGKRLWCKQGNITKRRWMDEFQSVRHWINAALSQFLLHWLDNHVASSYILPAQQLVAVVVAVLSIDEVRLNPYVCMHHPSIYRWFASVCLWTSIGSSSSGSRMNDWRRHVWSDGWMYECMDVWMEVWMNVWMDGCMDGWMYEWMNEWMYGWLYGYMYVCRMEMDGCISLHGIGWDLQAVLVVPPTQPTVIVNQSINSESRSIDMIYWLIRKYCW